MNNLVASPDDFYRDLRLVADYAASVQEKYLSKIINPNPIEKNVLEMFLRCFFWIRSLSKLDETCDFQAVFSGCRALFEISIDLVLLKNDKDGELTRKMVAWEDSAKFELSKQIRDYFEQQKESIPDEYSPQIDFLVREGDRINELRNRFYPNLKGKHPKNRWTGSNDLSLDIETVDSTDKSLIESEFGMSFTHFYKTEMKQLHWRTHGSALTCMRSVHPAGIRLSLGLVLKNCSDLTMLCIKILLFMFKFWDSIPSVSIEFNELKNQRYILFFKKNG
jgi:hypothetical protein